MKQAIYFFFSLCLVYVMAGCAERAQEAPAMAYVTIEDFTHEYPPESQKSLPVSVQTLGEAWAGKVNLDLMQQDSSLQQWQESLEVEADTQRVVQFNIQLPQQEGTYHLVASIENFDGGRVRSRRLIKVQTPIRVRID